MLAHGAQVDAPNHVGIRLLHVAACVGDVRCVVDLAGALAKANALDFTDANDRSALHHAAQGGDLKVTTNLLDSGA